MISNMLWAQMHFYELSWSYEIIGLSRSLIYESMFCKKCIIWVKFKVKQRIVYEKYFQRIVAKGMFYNERLKLRKNVNNDSERNVFIK